MVATVAVERMVAPGGGGAHLWQDGKLWRWSFFGYRDETNPPTEVEVLTPAPIVTLLRQGFRYQVAPVPSDS